MIFSDIEGYPLNETKDAMDSCVRQSIITLHQRSLAILDYVKDGLVRRHPNQYPANNPWNCTRDQTTMAIAALHKIEAVSVVREIFIKTLKRCFFAQNFERDVPGSVKIIVPHDFYKDSIPNYTTYLRGFDFKKFKFVQSKIATPPGVTIESKNFDFADPQFPNHLGSMIHAGEVWWMYWLLPISWMFHLGAIYFNKPESEQNQLIAECSVYGTLPIYRWLWPNWIQTSRKYWSDRNEIEYHYMLMEIVEEKV